MITIKSITKLVNITLINSNNLITGLETTIALLTIMLDKMKKEKK